MSLKQMFLKQSIWVLTVTMAVTIGCGLLSYYFSGLITSQQVIRTEVIVAEGGKAIYQTTDFSDFEIKEILMHLDVKKTGITIGKIDYDISYDSNQGGRYVIRLTPKQRFADHYKGLLFCVFAVFAITFSASGAAVMRHNMKHMVLPLERLKKQTENLRTGELDLPVSDEGLDEIKVLGQEIEQLRIKLKDSVYYRQKYDEDRKFFISSISHDLKTPVTALRGYIDGILDGVAATEDKRQAYLKKATDKITLITNMIDDLLLHSKLDMNQVPFNITRVSAADFMAACVADNTFAFESQGKSVTLENRLDAAVFINIDSTKFRRVVQNIMDNAEKNIAEGGFLKIILRDKQNALIIEFKDNGSGINCEDLPRIFDRFYRADAARAVEGSSGLGLAIARQIIEGLGGRIWASSVLGEGTAILISLKKV